MHLPTAKQLGEGLKRWREAKDLTAEDVVEVSKSKSSEFFSVPTLRRWEAGEGLSYHRLVADALPAYEIDDIDTFLDFCRPYTTKDIRVVREADFLRSDKDRGLKSRYAPTTKLEINRTRIDRLMLNSGEKSDWSQHSGHEFVLVLRGSVEFQFAETERSKDDPVKHVLGKYDAIAFSSLIRHQVVNKGDNAVLLVARPTVSQATGGVTG